MSGVSRRGLLGWFGGLIVAAPALPAIIEEASRTAVATAATGVGYTSAPCCVVSGSLGAQLAEITRKAMVPKLYDNMYRESRVLAHFKGEERT
jgi:hypothetical protein